MTAAPDSTQRGAEIEAAAVLSKPFDLNHALEVVRRCLGARGHHGGRPAGK
jgi:hypothetical protein